MSYFRNRLTVIIQKVLMDNKKPTQIRMNNHWRQNLRSELRNQPVYKKSDQGDKDKFAGIPIVIDDTVAEPCVVVHASDKLTKPTLTHYNAYTNSLSNLTQLKHDFADWKEKRKRRGFSGGGRS